MQCKLSKLFPTFNQQKREREFGKFPAGGVNVTVLPNIGY